MATGALVKEMLLVCHMISQDHIVKGSCDFMVSHNPATFYDHRNCVSADMFLVDMLFNLPLLFIPKSHGMEVRGM